MKHLEEASKDLMKHLVFVLQHSMDLKKDGSDPMIPFALVVKSAEETLKTFVGDTPDYADQMFEKTIRVENPDYVVYASDSYLTTKGIKYDAVLFKAYDKNDSEIYLVGQKFKPKSDDQEFEEIGNPGFLGTISNDFYIPKQSANRESKSDNNKPWWKIW